MHIFPLGVNSLSHDEILPHNVLKIWLRNSINWKHPKSGWAIVRFCEIWLQIWKNQKNCMSKIDRKIPKIQRNLSWTWKWGHKNRWLGQNLLKNWLNFELKAQKGPKKFQTFLKRQTWPHRKKCLGPRNFKNHQINERTKRKQNWRKNSRNFRLFSLRNRPSNDKPGKNQL